MERETIEKANALCKRLDHLSEMIETLLSNNGCSSIGFGLLGRTIGTDPHYKFNIHSLFDTNTGDECQIARAGIKAMYEKAIELEEAAEKELKAL